MEFLQSFVTQDRLTHCFFLVSEISLLWLSFKFSISELWSALARSRSLSRLLHEHFSSFIQIRKYGQFCICMESFQCNDLLLLTYISSPIIFGKTWSKDIEIGQCGRWKVGYFGYYWKSSLPRCYIDRPLFLLFEFSSQFFRILLEIHEKKNKKHFAIA